MTKTNALQLTMTFPGETPEEIKRRNQESILGSIIERYPMPQEEATWLPLGIRLARFVPLWECETCPFNTEDHTLGSRFPSKVCVKDLRTKGDIGAYETRADEPLKWMGMEIGQAATEADAEKGS